jgi:hypothetical protein
LKFTPAGAKCDRTWKQIHVLHFESVKSCQKTLLNDNRKSLGSFLTFIFLTVLSWLDFPFLSIYSMTYSSKHEYDCIHSNGSITFQNLIIDLGKWGSSDPMISYIKETMFKLSCYDIPVIHQVMFKVIYLSNLNIFTFNNKEKAINDKEAKRRWIMMTWICFFLFFIKP